MRHDNPAGTLIQDTRVFTKCRKNIRAAIRVKPSQRREVADVVPLKVTRDDGKTAVFRRGFGDGVVDGNLGDCRPHSLEHGGTFGRVPRVGYFINGIGHIRSVRAKFFEENTRLRYEHSCVPQVSIALDVFSRFVQAGFFNKTNHSMRATRPRYVQRLTRLDVAESCRRRRRADTNRDDESGRGSSNCFIHRSDESALVIDDVVRRKRTDDRIGVSPNKYRGRENDRCGRILRGWLENSVVGGEHRKLMRDGLRVGLSAHHNNVVPRDWFESIPRFDEEASTASGEVVKEFRGVGTRERPQP